jgi:hypothetical protein
MILEYRAKEKMEVEVLEEKKLEESKVHLSPSKRASVFAGFNESREIQAYYLDLVRRYGSVMESYKDEILGCKTLKEAMKIWVDIMAEVSAPKTHKVTEALDPEDRKRIIESQTGTRIRTTSEFQNRLPKSNDPNGESWV